MLQRRDRSGWNRPVKLKQPPRLIQTEGVVCPDGRSLVGIVKCPRSSTAHAGRMFGSVITLVSSQEKEERPIRLYESRRHRRETLHAPRLRHA